MFRRASFVLLCLLFLGTPRAFAQGASTTTTISGQVVDPAGHAVAGAAVSVTSDATGATTKLITSKSGRFTAAGIVPAVYHITVSVAGHRTLNLTGVHARPEAPPDLRITLESGSPSDRVDRLLETTGAASPVARLPPMFDARDLDAVPLVSRNLLSALTFMPGVDRTTTDRAATIFGLPAAAVSVTLDGVNLQDHLLTTTGGVYGYVGPGLDEVNSVSLSGPVLDAGATGGAAQVRFVTRSGASRFSGSVSDNMTTGALDSNSYFNRQFGLPTNRRNTQDFGATAGGTLAIPHLVSGGKVFFFVAATGFRSTFETARQRTILTPAAQAGVFSYPAVSNGAPVTSIDMIALSASKGLPLFLDPTMTALLTQIRAATQTTGVTTSTANPNTLLYTFQSPASRDEVQPTGRVDAAIGARQRLTGTFSRRAYRLSADMANGLDAAFPGFPNFESQRGSASTGTASWQSSLGPSLLNEFSFGGLIASPAWMSTTPDQFANQGGNSVHLDLFPAVGSLSNVTGNQFNQSRRDASWTVDDSLHWALGPHQLTFGVNASQVTVRTTSQAVVPSITLTADGFALSYLTAANLPGASAADVADARALSGLLSGSVLSATARTAIDEASGQYRYLGPLVERVRGRQAGVFVEDVWRPNRNLTIEGGLRAEGHAPATFLNNVLSTATLADICGISGMKTGTAGRSCNFNSPNVLTGTPPQFTQMTAGSHPYASDYHVAPAVSAALNLGPAGTVRGGYSVSYQRNGLNDVLAVYAANRGPTSSVTVPFGCFPDFMTVRVSNPCLASTAQWTPFVPASPIYPLTPFTTGSVNIVDPALRTPFIRAGTLGLEHSLGSRTTVEVRYVGTRGVDQWTNENWDEIDVLHNGFLKEFTLAQANLQANLQQGRGATFAYFGSNSGTSPLPIYLQYLQPFSSNPNDPTQYASTRWTNSTIVNHLSSVNPLPLASARDVIGNSPGAIPNFFEVNPDVASANVLTNGGHTSYDALELIVHHRSRGLMVEGSFTAAKRRTSVLDTIASDPVMVIDTAGVPRAMKLVASYEVPFGRDRRHGAGIAPWLDAIAGRWMIGAAVRVQTGQVLRLSGVRLVNMTPDDLQAAFAIRFDPATRNVYDLPQDIIDNTIKAFSTDATTLSGYGPLGAPTGRYIAPASGNGCVEVHPGDCGEPHDLVVTGPLVSQVDLRFSKPFLVRSGVNLEVGVDVFNLLNQANFTPVFQASSDPRINQVTGANDTAGRQSQVLIRVRW